MPYIRTKTIKGIEYRYLVESTRINGKPRQRVIAYLGQHSTVPDAYRYWQQQAADAPNAAGRKHARQMVKKLEALL